jgi:hypothetical protein
VPEALFVPVQQHWTIHMLWFGDDPLECLADELPTCQLP